MSNVSELRRRLKEEIERSGAGSKNALDLAESLLKEKSRSVRRSRRRADHGESKVGSSDG